MTLLVIPEILPQTPLPLLLISYFCILVVGFVAGVSMRDKVR